MVKKSTQHLLIQHIYGETTTTETLNIKSALQTDFFVNEEHQLLLESYQALPVIKLFPPKRIIKNILDYSRNAVCV